MNFTAVLTSRVLTVREMEQYRQELGIEFKTIVCRTEDELLAATGEADAVITLMQPYSRRVIEGLSRCRLIYCAGTGFESIDLAAATERAICVAYPGDYCKEEVAEHAMALLLAVARKITRLDKAVRAGAWATFERREIRSKILPPLFKVKGRTLGLVGFGRIARATVPKARGFGLRVIAFDPYATDDAFAEEGVERVSVDRLVAESDFISIEASSGHGSRHLFGYDEFSRMKRTAYIINVGRGSFMDEEALQRALSEGLIAGAGLDVLEGEQGGIPPDHPLLAFDNVIVTGHSAYYSEDSAEAYRQRLVNAVVRAAHGEWPDWVVNPEVRERFLERWKAGQIR